ncbi:hypothetical protein GN958_ATG03129 [Phytophthora infestans]|uniref:Uncharacterized protein n=1 Tax=Phytophthora infestans TaxID=4787 RepID=A0A8S9V8S1_PHYIN|nr:hypothetical protein GN958_ATG03129 [Phytophthora infestans]
MSAQASRGDTSSIMVPKDPLVEAASASPRLSLLSQQQAPCIASLAAMISPLKDIVIATVLGIGAGMVWNNFKDGELDRIGQFYKWYDAQEAQKKSLHADD